MRFKRISTDTVRCIITQDELRANGLEVDDFLTNSGRTEEFLRKMVTLAEQEVGFKVQGGPMTIQVAVLPENKLALTFSERQGGNLMELLEGLRAAMSTLSEAVNESREKAEEAAAAEARKERYLLQFEDIESLRSFCMGIDDDVEEKLHMDSGLYLLEDANVYCLVIERGDMDEKQVCQVMAASVEFMDAASADEGQAAYVLEHGRSVLESHAISQLQKLFAGHDIS